MNIIRKIFKKFYFMAFHLVPGRTKRTNRNSCSHQLCECDREFAMCLNKYLPCPKAKVECIVGGANRFLENIFKGLGIKPSSGHKKKPSHHSGSNKHTNIPHGHRHHNRQGSVSSTPRKSQNSFDPFKIFG